MEPAAPARALRIAGAARSLAATCNAKRCTPLPDFQVRFR